MVHRDLIMDEIQRMGNVLRMILGRFLNLEPDDNVNIAFHDANKHFSEQFNIHIDDLLTLNSDDLRLFVDTRHLTAGHCDQIAQILYITSSKEELVDQSKKQRYLSKAGEFLNIAEQKTDILSLDRMDLKSRIAQQLNK